MTENEVNLAQNTEKDVPLGASQDTDMGEADEPIEFVVGLPFNSEYRRHRVGDEIKRADLEKSRLDFDHLVENGFIVEQPVETPTSQKEKEPSQ